MSRILDPISDGRHVWTGGRAHREAPAAHPVPARGVAVVASPDYPLVLESGAVLTHAQLAFESFGPADAERTVLVCHALTGDAHVTRRDPSDPDERRGWWETLVGPGGPVDTTRVRVLCANVLGGCAGSTGPMSTEPISRRRYGPAFPRVTIGDMVEAQARLLDALAIRRRVSVIGGSIGGFQALEWIRRFPERTEGAAVIASGAALNAFGLAFNRVARNAILADARFHNGWYSPADPPALGLATARQLAHLTYRTAESFEDRFGRTKQDGRADAFAVQSYLEHKGRSFVDRFDANTYLGLLDAMDAYDADAGGDLERRLALFGGRMLVAGFLSDGLFPPEQSAELARRATEAGVPTALELIDTPHGHDAFLMPSAALGAAVRRWLDHEGEAT